MKLLASPEAFQNEFKRLMRQYSHFDWAVAWASNGTATLDTLRRHQAKIRNVVIGTHFHQTHPEFLEEFARHPGVRFRLDPQGTNGVFHPKVYLFSNDDHSWEAVIGSANFTTAAFSRNVEHSILFGSADAPEDVGYAELLTEVQKLWAAGARPNADQLTTYRRNWEKNRKALGGIEGRDGDVTRRKGLYECDLLIWGWSDFFTSIQNGSYFRDRLNMLGETDRIFAEKHSLEKMSLPERRRICGTATDDVIKWRLFGSMIGSRVFSARIRDNDPHISAALDQIPERGTRVSREHFKAYLDEFRKAFVYGKPYMGLAVLTRPLCIKRPDYFVCIDSENKERISTRIGVQKGEITPDTYWDLVISPLMETRWWQSELPPGPDEAAVWYARTAMIDSLFYAT